MVQKDNEGESKEGEAKLKNPVAGNNLWERMVYWRKLSTP